MPAPRQIDPSSADELRAFLTEIAPHDWLGPAHRQVTARVIVALPAPVDHDVVAAGEHLRDRARAPPPPRTASSPARRRSPPASACSARTGSHTTRSASLPAAITPLRGYRPKIRAGASQATSTSRSAAAAVAAQAKPSGSRAPIPGSPVAHPREVAGDGQLVADRAAGGSGRTQACPARRRQPRQQRRPVVGGAQRRRHHVAQPVRRRRGRRRRTAGGAGTPRRAPVTPRRAAPRRSPRAAPGR